MSTAAWIFLSLVWVSAVVLVVFFFWLRSPKKRKTSDEIEGSISALRGRVTDLDDRLEHHVKREAVRIGREKRDNDLEQSRLPGVASNGMRLLGRGKRGAV